MFYMIVNFINCKTSTTSLPSLFRCLRLATASLCFPSLHMPPNRLPSLPIFYYFLCLLITAFLRYQSLTIFTTDFRRPALMPMPSNCLLSLPVSVFMSTYRLPLLPVTTYIYALLPPPTSMPVTACFHYRLPRS